MNSTGSRSRITQPLYVGIDVGASGTKAAVLDQHRQVVGHGVVKSGIDFTVSAQTAFRAALKMAGISRDQIVHGVSTGYGRKNVSFAQATKTEISCHARGCFQEYPLACSIIDIGGQDNKIIHLDAAGKRTGFMMNRKCAAGTGAFLEEMSARLDIPLHKMDTLARGSRDMVRLGSFCTVFSATEVLENIRQGRRIEDIAKGVFFSIIKRVLEMGALSQNVVMTGGVVAHNPYLVEMTHELIERKVSVPAHPQLTGAIGAALYAMEAAS